MLRHLRWSRRHAGALQRLRLLLPEVAGRLLLLARTIGAVGLLLGACHSSTPQCVFAGDPTAAVEIGHLFVLDPGAGGAMLIEPTDGGAVPLRQPVQGGFVLYVGALLRNLVA